MAEFEAEFVAEIEAEFVAEIEVVAEGNMMVFDYLIAHFVVTILQSKVTLKNIMILFIKG